jgi:hypothetical protein
MSTFSSCPDCRSHERRLSLAKEYLQGYVEQGNDFWIKDSERYVQEKENAYDEHLRKAHGVEPHRY